MRFVSTPAGGYRVFAVTGTNAVSFGIDFSAAQTAGLLGFAVEREDPAESERYYLYGEKVFQSIIPHPDGSIQVSTHDQPVQSFVWDDFTAKPGRKYNYWFHPLAGTPKNLDRSAPPIAISVTTEDHGSAFKHDVFFNRGVATSQAYAHEFQNQKPDAIADPAEKQRAFAWLSRGLEEALLQFIADVPAGDTLLGCFYEFAYDPVLEALKAAQARGVAVKLILDGKPNGYTDKQGTVHEAEPLTENKTAVTAAGIDNLVALWRVHNPDAIQHNKFMVRMGGGTQPLDVWTGSTNVTESGIFGQVNVGHRVRDPALAARYAAYWNALLADPGSTKGDDRTTATAAAKKWRTAVEALGTVPADWSAIPAGTTPVFSPRTGGGVLAMYVKALAEAQSLACITLAFGIGQDFKTALAPHNAQSPVSFLLLESRDVARSNAKTPFVPLGARQNVYEAWGSYLKDPVYQWVRETNMRLLGIATHVAYIHSKFLLHDPLGADPIVITGSANFSADSTNDNDENMLLIRGDTRVADIYFTEFNRLFFHYYFRSIVEELGDGKPASGNAAADQSASLFLDETDGWLKKYAPGTLRAKRVGVFTAMAGAQAGQA